MNQIQKISRLGIVVLILATALSLGAAEKGPRWNANADGVVIDGYDVVAFHTQDRAARGSAEHAAKHDGGTFYFASADNKASFLKDPNKYTPKFGGFCAFGVAAQKAKAPADPRTFKIYNGELLLFYNDLYQGQPMNTKVMWNQNEKHLYQEATGVWRTLN